MIKAIIFDFFGVLEADGAPNEPILEYIRTELKPKYKLGIISNAAADWVSETLSKEDVALFDDVIISYKAGLSKPQAAVYELSQDNLGVRADQAVFIDDIEDYCVAARSIGMKAICYKDFKQMKADLGSLLSAGPNK